MMIFIRAADRTLEGIAERGGRYSFMINERKRERERVSE